MTSRKTRILIIDDDVSLSRLMHLMLDKTQMYEVRVENRAANAIATAHSFRPGLILLDLEMPGKNGGRVMREMQADPILKYVKIIFISALFSKDQSDGKVVERNGVWYLAKPVDPMTLIDTIEEALGSASAEAPAGM